MDEIKMSVKAIASNMNITIEQLANRAGINANHLKNVSAGRVEMSADDLIKLSDLSGVPVRNIAYKDTCV